MRSPWKLLVFFLTGHIAQLPTKPGIYHLLDPDQTRFPLLMDQRHLPAWTHPRLHFPGKFCSLINGEAALGCSTGRKDMLGSRGSTSTAPNAAPIPQTATLPHHQPKEHLCPLSAVPPPLGLLMHFPASASLAAGGGRARGLWAPLSHGQKGKVNIQTWWLILNTERASKDVINVNDKTTAQQQRLGTAADEHLEELETNTKSCSELVVANFGGTWTNSPW